MQLLEKNDLDGFYKKTNELKRSQAGKFLAERIEINIKLLENFCAEFLKHHEKYVK